MPYVMQCAWCGTIQGTKASPSAEEEPLSVTHTICPPCYVSVINEIHHARDKGHPGPLPALSIFLKSE